MLVEGAIAGESAAQYAKKVGMPEIDERQVEKLGEKVLSPLKRKDGIKPAELRKRIQKMAHAKLGPVRTREGIEELLRFIDVVKEKELPKLYVSSESRKYNKEWVEAIELENIIQIIELSAKSALMRTESRGVHYRLDHPYTDNDNWLKEIVVKRVNNGVNVVTRPVKATKLPLPCGVIPYWEMMKMMMKMHSDIGGHH
jgi:succinate dehydrogenase/fumarate reductase flavoprotein subunit